MATKNGPHTRRSNVITAVMSIFSLSSGAISNVNTRRTRENVGKISR